MPRLSGQLLAEIHHSRCLFETQPAMHFLTDRIIDFGIRSEFAAPLLASPLFGNFKQSCGHAGLAEFRQNVNALDECNWRAVAPIRKVTQSDLQKANCLAAAVSREEHSLLLVLLCRSRRVGQMLLRAAIGPKTFAKHKPLFAVTGRCPRNDN